MKFQKIKIQIKQSILMKKSLTLKNNKKLTELTSKQMLTKDYQ